MKVAQERINTLDIAKIVVSVEKINSEMGNVRDRVTTIETNITWIKWFVMFNTVALVGLVINSFIR